MALPSSLTGAGSRRNLYGVVIAPQTNNSDFSISIRRTSDDGTGSPATSAAFIIGTMYPRQQSFVDFLPNDNQNRHYQAFHTRKGYSDGTATDWLCAKPVNLSGEDQIVPEIEGARRGAAGLNRALPVTKNRTWPAAEFKPASNNTQFAFSNAFLHPDSTQGSTGLQNLHSAFVLPEGVTITDATVRIFQATSAVRTEIQLIRATSVGGVTLLADLSPSTSELNQWVEKTTTLTETVGADDSYYWLAIIAAGTSDSLDSRTLWTQLTYDSPDYDKTL